MFLVAYTQLFMPLCRSVRRSVRLSVHPSVRHTLLFLGFWDFWLHCSCPNDLVTSIMAPAHPHATGVAVYPALLTDARLPRRSASTDLYAVFCQIGTVKSMVAHYVPSLPPLTRFCSGLICYACFSPSLHSPAR